MHEVAIPHRFAHAGLALCFLVVGCASSRTAPAPTNSPVLPPALPPLSVEVLTVPSKSVTAPDAVKGKGSRLTLSASNVDVRELLPALASAAGVSMVMAPDVRGRVTVHFVNADARDVLRAVIEQAGLTVGPVELIAPFPKPLFLDLPVNVNEASAAAMQVRFGISAALADLIVTSRPR